jgi:hypothetical protein
MKMKKQLLVSLVMAWVCGSAFAQWQWIDKDGRKVFSDRAPSPDVPEKSIIKRPAGAPKNAVPATAETAAAKDVPAPGASPLPAASSPKVSGVDKELEARKKQAADAEAAKLKAEQDRQAKARAENCARVKQAKEAYDSGVRISRTNAAGEREVLDDAARATELKRIQGLIDNECK